MGYVCRSPVSTWWLLMSCHRGAVLTGYMVPDSGMVLEEFAVDSQWQVGSEVVAGAGVREVAVFRAPVTAVEEIVASVVCRGVGC